MSIKQPAILATEKECKQCKFTKSTSLFYKQRQIDKDKVWEYFDSVCKSCRLTISTKRRQEIKKKALDYLGWECNKCKLIDKDYPQIYDFHHTNSEEKDFEISKTSKSFEKLKPELDKCIVLCANCHRREHAIE